MIVIEKNEGEKIPYEVSGARICFDDDLSLNLKKRESDDPVHIDICYDCDRSLVVDTATGREFVAEIDIPARRYELVEAEAESAGEDEQTDEKNTKRVPLPFDMERVTLTLWAI